MLWKMSYEAYYCYDYIQYCYADMCSDSAVRIAGGSDDFIGRVEVCVNGTWGTVCGDGWNNYSASVVCEQMEFSPQGSESSKTAPC